MSEYVDFAQAANYMGISRSGLRKIINRSRVRLSGTPVRGPTIKFRQEMPHGPIRFRKDWLDTFLEHNAKDPSKTPLPYLSKPNDQPFDASAGFVPEMMASM
jgi:hypothetical protein